MEDFHFKHFAIQCTMGKLKNLKWSTLTNHFSAHFCTKGAKFLIEMSKLPKNLEEEEKIDKDVRQKKQNTCCACLGIFLEKDLGTPPSPPPPSKIDETLLLFYKEFLLLTFEEGSISFVSGGPYGPMGEPTPSHPP